MKKSILFLIIISLLIGLSVKAGIGFWSNHKTVEKKKPVVVLIKKDNPTVETKTEPAEATSTDSQLNKTKNSSRQTIIEYTVKPGDVVGSIAHKFNLKINSILNEVLDKIKPSEKEVKDIKFLLEKFLKDLNKNIKNNLKNSDFNFLIEKITTLNLLILLEII